MSNKKPTLIAYSVKGRAECHGARLVPSTPQAAACSAALRPDGDRAAFRGRGEGAERRAFPARFRWPAARRTKGMNVSTSPLQHCEQARRAIALRGVALAGGPVIFAQGEQRRLLRGRRRLGAARRHQVAPQIGVI